MDSLPQSESTLVLNTNSYRSQIAYRLRQLTDPSISEPVKLHIADVVAGLASNLIDLIEWQRERLRIIAESFETWADEIGCDAGNPDGGSTATCEHCRLIQDAHRVRAMIGDDNVDSGEEALDGDDLRETLNNLSDQVIGIAPLSGEE